MSTHRFSTGTQFHWREALYEVKRLLPGNDVNIEEVATGAVPVKPLQQLIDAWVSGELVFAAASRRAGANARANGQSQDGAECADLIPTSR